MYSLRAGDRQERLFLCTSQQRSARRAHPTEEGEAQMKPDRRWIPLALVLLAIVAVVAAAQQPAAPPEEPLTILLSNDDGYGARGLVAMIRAMSGWAHLYVAAPAVDQSGKGHSIVTRDPIYLNRLENPDTVAAYSLEATPATCVRVALNELVPKSLGPHLVISGINRGENLGLSVYLSGTVGAAREAAFSGIPAIAVSMDIDPQRPRADTDADYDRLAAYVKELVGQLRKQGELKPGLFLNINGPVGEPKGVRVTRQTVIPSRQIFEQRENLRRRIYYWSDYEPVHDDAEGTDTWAVKRGFISITPMTLDTTQAGAIAGLKKFEQGK
jgi:5'-nucleotidase